MRLVPLSHTVGVFCLRVFGFRKQFLGHGVVGGVFANKYRYKQFNRNERSWLAKTVPRFGLVYGPVPDDPICRRG